MLTFMPGYNQAAGNGGVYPAPELHRLLYEGVQARITLAGGVSSAGDLSRRIDGLQFTHQQVLRDAIVAASISTGVPIGVSLNDGLLDTGKVLCVTKVSTDGRTVLEFDGRSARERLGANGPEVMLARLTTNSERVVDVPLLAAEGSVQLPRQLKEGTYFEVLRPAPRIVETAQRGITQAKQRVYMERPVGSLLFPSTAYNSPHGRDTLKMENAFVQVEKDTGHRPCIGGFLDGELGIDETGRSRLTNGGLAYLIFGDEMRERTPLYKGVSALAEYGPKFLAGSELTQTSIYEAIDNALNLIDKAGFPGAMISLVMSNSCRVPDETRNFIIACNAVGARFPKIIEHTQHPVESFDILAIVVNEKRARFVPDSRVEPSCDPSAIERSGLISQYVLPLRTLDNTVFGTLQVDMGDLRHLSAEEFQKTEKARVLDCFAEVIGAGINRIANAIENHIMLSMDKALKESLSANSVSEGLERFLMAAGTALGVENGHLWLVPPDDGLVVSTDKPLILETGFGPCYAVHKLNLSEVHANALARVHSAFHSNGPRIINDLRTDLEWSVMTEGVPHDADEPSPLVRARSYAAVAFENECGRKLGAVSFSSFKPWFFFKFHRNALVTLAERLGFLVGHLSARVRLKFLSEVSTRLAERNLNAAEMILQNVTDDFRLALKADAASLYLWDQDREKYVLRAQSNWKDPRWVHAANYSADAGWIGIGAINKKPLYVADLHEYYVEHQYDYPNGRYAEYMLGRPLTNSFSVEAIGLPLRVGPTRKDKVGVLTLYRRIEKGRPSGFISTDMQLLQEGAYNVAGLVNAVLRHRYDIWEKDEEDRHQTVYQALSSDDDGDYIEAKICREVLKAFRATEVEFYRVDKLEAVMRYSWIAGYRRLPAGEIIKLSEASDNHDDLLNEAVGVERDVPVYRVAERRRRLGNDRHVDPAVLKTEGLVEQVCIPVLSEKDFLAALVLRWGLSPAKAFSPDVHHSAHHLQKLGRMIGSTYSRNRIKKQALQSELAVRTAGVYVFQHAHRLGNAIQGLYRIAQEIRAAQDEDVRLTKVEELEMTATNNIEMIDWVINLGELVQTPAREMLSLHQVIQESWHDVTTSDSWVADFEFSLTKEITIIADPRLMKEVFINLMDNALKAMKLKKGLSGERPVLKVNAIVSEDKETVDITLKDNGVGMTPEQIDAAERGFVSAEGHALRSRHKGIGVLISRYLLRVQDGSLAYKSVAGEGTEAIITLPNFPAERK
jgi:signal transduction histidine kinase